jgi:elongation factor G
MDVGRIRNIGIVAHIDAGKTTLSERLLHQTGVIRRAGAVHEGTTTLDWMEEERKRGITITAAAATLPWREHALHLIDTPGHVDFTLEVERSMRVLDGAILLLSAVHGVQAQTETVWRQVRRHKVPALLYVNQMDRVGADYQRCCEQARTRLGVRPLQLQLPLGEGPEFSGVIDILARSAYRFGTREHAHAVERCAVPEEFHAEVEVLRSELVDVLAEQDEAVLAAALDGADIASDVLLRALRPRVLSGELLPVLCGSALRAIGVPQLLDAIVDLLPSPLDRGAVLGVDPRDGAAVERAPSEQEPVCALAFKALADANEDLVYVRVYSGSIRHGAHLLNTRSGRVERVGRVLRMLGEDRAAIESVGAGDIAALSGLHATASGDTLCDSAAPIRLAGLLLPEPVITQVFEPAEGAQRERLRAGLARLVFEDPALRVREDEDTGQWLVSGLGELHLEIARHRLEQHCKLPLRVGRPHVAYREALGRAARAHARVERVIGGHDAHGEIELEVAPRPPGSRSGIEIAWAPDGAVPIAFRGAIAEALQQGCSVGPLLGFPVHDAVIRVFGGTSVPGRDHVGAFAQAAVEALRSALEQASAHALEPVMRLELDTPSEYAGALIADLGARGAEVGEVLAEGERRRIRAEVSLARVFGYATAVRSLSQGRAELALEPCGFRPIEADVLRERGLYLG